MTDEEHAMPDEDPKPGTQVAALVMTATGEVTRPSRTDDSTED